MLGNLIYYGSSIIFILVFLPMLVNMIKVFVDTVAGCLVLKKMGSGSYQEIRLGDVSHGKTNHIRQIVICLLVLVLEIFCIKMCADYYSSMGLTIGFCELLVTIVLELIIFAVRYFHGADAYLTSEGIVSAEGIYKRGECRFAIETEGSAGGRKCINVYKEKAQVPIRFLVLEREEEVLQRIDNF